MKKTLISSSSGKLLAVGGIPRYISSDAAAINAVKQVKSFTISKNAADQLEVTFTPIINEKLFAEIEEGHTQIRLQLLTHKRCGDTYVDGTVLLPKIILKINIMEIKKIIKIWLEENHLVGLLMGQLE